MADEDDALEREEDLGDLSEGAEGEDTQTDQGSEAGGEDTIDGGDAEDVVEVTFGDEAAPPVRGEDSDLIRRLRAEIKDRDKRVAAVATPPVKIEVGEKPTLESCEYDEAKFETELTAWHGRKADAARADEQAQQQSTAVQARFAEKVADFGRQKQALKAPDFEAAEGAVVSTLSQIQQAVIIKVAKDSAKVIYAIGRHPAKLTALAAIDDPIEFAGEIARMEGTISVTTRRKAAEPDESARGSAPLRAGEDKQLARLEAEADRTGDRTKLRKYRMEQQAKKVRK